MSSPVLLVLIGGPLLLTMIGLAARSATRRHTDVRNEWRWVWLMRAAAVIVGSVAAWLISDSLDLGRGAMLVPSVLGLFLVAGVGFSEAVVRPPRPTGVRTASLARRRVVDYLPRTLCAAVGAITVLHLATLALTTVSASADDLGRAGRQIAAWCQETSSAASPYPGSFYSIPLTLMLCVIGVVAVASLMTIVRRPRGFAPDDVGDDALRERSATQVLSALGAAVAASHAGIVFFAGTALLRMGCQHTWMAPVGWLLVATIPAALLLLVWFLYRLVGHSTAFSSAPGHTEDAK